MIEPTARWGGGSKSSERRRGSGTGPKLKKTARSQAVMNEGKGLEKKKERWHTSNRFWRDVLKGAGLNSEGKIGKVTKGNEIEGRVSSSAKKKPSYQTIKWNVNANQKQSRKKRRKGGEKRRFLKR